MWRSGLNQNLILWAFEDSLRWWFANERHDWMCGCARIVYKRRSTVIRSLIIRKFNYRLCKNPNFHREKE